jgi:hypothetical protein
MIDDLLRSPHLDLLLLKASSKPGIIFTGTRILQHLSIGKTTFQRDFIPNQFPPENINNFLTSIFPSTLLQQP